LHDAIQDAFGWDNDHMFSFFLDKGTPNSVKKLYDTPSRAEYAGDPLGHLEKSLVFRDDRLPAMEYELRDLGLEVGFSFSYLFDYGDNILHHVHVVDIEDQPDPSVNYPRVVHRIGTNPQQYVSWE
jgi:hypothetical protein